MAKPTNTLVITADLVFGQYLPTGGRRDGVLVNIRS